MTIYKLTCQFRADSAARIRRMWCQSPSLELVNAEAATIEDMAPAIERLEVGD